MADAYDGNGDYSTYNDDDNDYGSKQQRKGGVGMTSGPHNGDNTIVGHHGGGVGLGGSGTGPGGGGGPSGDYSQLNDKAQEYIRDCITEKQRMDRKYPIAEKLLDTEVEKVQTTGRIPSREQKYADIYREKPLRVSQKVLVPIREHPKFNFVGKLLGPKGNSLRRLQEETLCKMTVLGRNSMRDRVKEEELRSSKDPKYAHLNSDLHVEISTIAPPAEAYARIAYAMAELRKYLIPDSNDIIRQEQLRELMDNTGISDTDVGKSTYKKIPTSAVHQTQSGVGTGGVGCMSGVGLSSSTGIGTTAAGSKIGGGVGGATQNVQHHGGYRASQQTQFAKNAVVPKQKVLSILEKARTAMDETYSRGYDDHLTYEQPSYDTYSTYGHASQTQTSHTHAQSGPQTVGMGGVSGAGGGGGSGVMGVGGGGGGARGPYDTQEYDSDYNRRGGDYYQQSANYGAPGGSVANQSGVGGLNPNHNRSHVNR